MGAPAALAQTLIPDNMDNTLSYSVLNYLKRLKNSAKMEFDRLCNEVISKQAANKSLQNGNSNTVVEGLRVTSRTTLKKDLVRCALFWKELELGRGTLRAWPKLFDRYCRKFNVFFFIKISVSFFIHKTKYY